MTSEEREDSLHAKAGVPTVIPRNSAVTVKKCMDIKYVPEVRK